MSRFFTPAPKAGPWTSPVFVPTVHLGPWVRRKDRAFFTETNMAIADRWGLGSVYDLNPDGAVYDLYPRPMGREAEWFPEAPVSQIYPQSQDEDDIDLFEDVLGPQATHELFGSMAVEQSASSEEKKRKLEAVKTLLPEKARKRVEAIESTVKKALAPPPAPVIVQAKAPEADRTGEYVAIGLGVAAAFGVGFALGRRTK